MCLHLWTIDGNHRILTNLFPVVPASVVHPLTKQLNRGLSPICLQHGHVQVINEKDKILPKRRSKHSLAPFHTKKIK